MNKFKIDKNKIPNKTQIAVKVLVNAELYRWIKAMAALNDVTIACALDQSIEYARKNSERISL